MIGIVEFIHCCQQKRSEKLTSRYSERKIFNETNNKMKELNKYAMSIFLSKLSDTLSKIN